MSPPGSCVFEARVAVVERHATVESLAQLNFGSSEAKASRLGRDLKAASIPLHDIIVADHAFVSEATDAFQVVGSLSPSFRGVARSAGEAAIVVGEEAAQDAVGGIQIVGLSQAEFAGETILKHAPEAFDAALGLGALSGDESDAELIQSAAELRGLLFAGEFFLNGPMAVVAHEDAAAIAIESEGDTEAAKQAMEQVEIACGGFREEKLSGEDFAGGVILHAEGGESGATALEPVVGRAIELDQFAFAGRAETALTMSGWAALARGAETFTAEQAAQGFAAEREALLLDQLFAEVMIVEAGIAGTRQGQNAGADARRQTAMAGTAAAGVCQSRCAALPVAGFEAFDVSRCDVEQLRGSGTRQVSPHTLGDDFHSLQFLLTQRECLRPHRVTFSRCC